MEKMTEKQIYTAIMNGTIDHDTCVAFCEKKIKALDAKAEKAKERAAKRANEGDALMDAIYGVLTNEPKTIAEIVTVLNDETITPNKVSARAAKLIEAGKAEKYTVTVDKRKLVAYGKAE